MSRYGQLLREVAERAEPGAASSASSPGATPTEAPSEGSPTAGGGSGAASSPAGEDQVVRLRRRAESAEAELAELRRSAARALLRLQREVAYWRRRTERPG